MGAISANMFRLLVSMCDLVTRHRLVQVRKATYATMTSAEKHQLQVAHLRRRLYKVQSEYVKSVQAMKLAAVRDAARQVEPHKIRKRNALVKKWMGTPHGVQCPKCLQAFARPSLAEKHATKCDAPLMCYYCCAPLPHMQGSPHKSYGHVLVTCALQPILCDELSLAPGTRHFVSECMYCDVYANVRYCHQETCRRTCKLCGAHVPTVDIAKHLDDHYKTPPK